MSLDLTQSGQVDVSSLGDGPCYVYGVTHSGLDPTALAAVEGMGAHGPALLEQGRVAAVVEVLDNPSALGTRQDLLAHYRVLDAIAAEGVVLPMRFGSVLTDAEAAQAELLEPHHDEFVASLAALEGHAQLILRARYVQDVVLGEVVAENPAIEELRARTRALSEDASYYDRIRLGELVAQAVDAKRETDRELVLEALRGHVVDWSVREASGIDTLVEVSLLVADSQQAALEEAATEVARSMADRATFELVGPMAPYDFVPER